MVKIKVFSNSHNDEIDENKNRERDQLNRGWVELRESP